MHVVNFQQKSGISNYFLKVYEKAPYVTQECVSRVASVELKLSYMMTIRFRTDSGVEV